MAMTICLLILVASFSSLAVGNEVRDSSNAEGTGEVEGALSFTVKDIDGEDVALNKYLGKVVLIVNVASKCGLTPQYDQLTAIHKKYRDQGLAILAFPANNFLWQEPGTDLAIKTLCTTKFNVEFDLFSKISVKKKNQAPLYKFLTEKENNPKFSGPIKWNFTKFLLNRQGKVVDRFGPKTRPDDEAVVSRIEAELKTGK
jgi:glutathione peroxidase